MPIIQLRCRNFKSLSCHLNVFTWKWIYIYVTVSLVNRIVTYSYLWRCFLPKNWNITCFDFPSLILILHFLPGIFNDFNAILFCSKRGELFVHFINKINLINVLMAILTKPFLFNWFSSVFGCCWRCCCCCCC